MALTFFNVPARVRARAEWSGRLVGDFLFRKLCVHLHECPTMPPPLTSKTRRTHARRSRACRKHERTHIVGVHSWAGVHIANTKFAVCARVLVEERVQRSPPRVQCTCVCMCTRPPESSGPGQRAHKRKRTHARASAHFTL